MSIYLHDVRDISLLHFVGKKKIEIRSEHVDTFTADNGAPNERFPIDLSLKKRKNY